MALTEDQTPGISDGGFMTSRDQIRFHRWQEAFVRPGPDEKNWGDRSSFASRGMLQTSPAEISLYHTEHYALPSNRIRRRTLRIDGFVSIYAGYAGGELVTKPLRFDGKEMVINYSTSAAGGIRVELRNPNGRAIQGYSLDRCPEIFGDEIERTVVWKAGSDVSGLAGQEVEIRFSMRDADLYSFRFR